MSSMTNTEARKLLKVNAAIPVAFAAKNGKLFDHNGHEIDPRQSVPWVWEFGPFGSWPCTLEDAEKDFAEQPQWFDGDSWHLGYVVKYKQGWGYAASKENNNAS